MAFPGANATSYDDSSIMAFPGANATRYDDSGIMASSRANDIRYDVFLSFRGEDTRDSFTDHLYEALVRVGLHTFRDNDEIDRGQELKPEIERAIKVSEASIIVLSENYATSTWCLDELLLILEQRRECNHFVLPVFYHVDPSDVRRQKKPFKIEVKTSTRWTEDNVNRWKAALTKVADLTGLVLSGLLQDMGRSLVDRESPILAERSRVWRNEDSYYMLRNIKSSKTMKGLALDMHKLMEEVELYDEFKRVQMKRYRFWTDSLQEMDKLKLLQLNFVEHTESYKDFSEHLRWLCWLGFNESTTPSYLSMRNLVALDMSYSRLEEFEPPMVLQSLKILNLKSSWHLLKIHNISQLPNLKTLILWNCHRLVHVCETIGDLTSLALLNMTGCENLQRSFSLPRSLERLFLKDCNLECTDDFPLSFSDQSALQYLNLGNNLFELLPSYNHLKNLRVLDLSLCSRLKWLLCLPSTLAELYIYYCKSLEKVTFESRRFTLQEIGYEGCSNLSEIEGFIKLVPLAKLDEADLGHMKWLKEYQNHEMCLAGDDELMTGRSCHLQMLYEFNIMSTSLPDIKDPNMTPEYISAGSPSLSFDVPLCPKNRSLKGLNVTFKYTVSGEDWAWFAKINTTSGVDLMYNPKVFGKPGFGEVAIWLSYWPIGNTLAIGDKVNVSIVVMNGLEIQECGASLVYTDDEVANGTLQNNMEWVEILGGDLSRFQLSTGSYYLCRRDFFELMELGRLTPGWFRILVGDTIDDTEVRGWRKTGRPQQSYQSFTELKTCRCIVYGPESEEIYKIAEMSKSSFVDKTVEFTSSIVRETMKSATKASDMSQASVVKETIAFTSSSLKKKMESATFEFRKMKTKGLLDEPPIASHSKSTVAYPRRKSESIDVYLSMKEFANDYFGDYLKDALDRAGLKVSSGFHYPRVTPSQARASIIVLTERYARSSLLLDELLMILDKRRNSNLFVLPVFYQLESSNVRENVQVLLLGLKSMSRVHQWRAALMEITNLPGINFSRWSRNDNNTTGIREIVSIVKHALYPNPVCPPHPTEKDTRADETK